MATKKQLIQAESAQTNGKWSNSKLLIDIKTTQVDNNHPKRLTFTIPSLFQWSKIIGRIDA